MPVLTATRLGAPPDRSDKAYLRGPTAPQRSSRASPCRQENSFLASNWLELGAFFAALSRRNEVIDLRGVLGATRPLPRPATSCCVMYCCTPPPGNSPAIRSTRFARRFVALLILAYLSGMLVSASTQSSTTNSRALQPTTSRGLTRLISARADAGLLLSRKLGFPSNPGCTSCAAPPGCNANLPSHCDDDYCGPGNDCCVRV